MTIGNKKRRLAASASALALALTGVVAASGAAFAADSGHGTDPGHGTPNAANIDPSRDGSLTIVKHEGDAGDAGDGTQQTIDQPVLGGVEFTLWQIGVSDAGGNCEALNLTDPDAWAKVPTTGYPTTKPAGTTDGELCTVSDTDFAPRVKTTDDNGELDFGSLPLGLYYVEETNATGAYKMDGTTKVPVKVTTKAQPFYVTIPLPNDGDWLYDVYAYPKNQTSVTPPPSKEINKDQDQAKYNVGDTVQYTITQTVPALKADDDKYTSAKIWETFSDGMEFGATVGSVKVNGADVGYTVTPDPAAGAKNVTWALDATALAALSEGDVITVTFTGVVTEVTETGSIENPMSVDPEKPGYGSEFNGDKTPKPPVEPPNPITYWGQLKVTKVDKVGKTLAGAEFTVTLPDADGTCADAAGTAVSTGVAGDDGVVLWDYTDPASSPLGLWITNTNDEETANPAGKSKDYCLYETKAPAGYTAIAKPIKANIKPGTTNVLELDVTNTQKDGPDLPLTGANGTMLMTVGGVALVALAGGVYLVMRRRQAAEA